MADRRVLLGIPVELDNYLKPVGRGLQVLVAVPLTVALWWIQAWWWLPLPLVVTEAAYQILFWRRGDRPTRLVLDPEGIELHDPLRGEVSSIEPSAVQVATATWRRLERGSEVVVLLADAAGPRLAVRFTLPGPPDLAPHDVDLDAIDAALGGQAGVLRAVAPHELVARQRFTDPAGLAWMRANLPPEAWLRTGLRVWRGEAPALSPFGFHLHDPTAWLVLDGTRFELRGDGPCSGDLTEVSATVHKRTISLLVRTEDGPEEEVSWIPLVGLDLSPDVRVVFPAPAAEGRADEVPARPADLHTHPPEGAALVSHLLRVLPISALPAVLRLRLDSETDTMAAP